MVSLARRVALLCLDPWQLEGTGDHRPFNYAVRRIQAAILGHRELAEIELQLIESRSLDADALAQQIEEFDPDVIGASAYVWSFPTLLDACRKAKRARPDRTIVFGGPSARPEMFRLPQHADGADVVDAIVVGDGEACMQEILLAPDPSRASLLGINGLAVHMGSDWQLTPPRDYGPPDAFPSPYQMGLMPHGVTGQIESFRGCPLACSYCEWGDTGVQARTFGYEHLVKELVALRKVNAKGTWLVDPALNLNARAFSNLRRAEAEAGTLKALGSFRCEVYPSHLKDEHLDFLESTSARYAGIGLQSYDADVLKGVDRPFREDRFNRVVGEVASIVPDTVVEVILGLPGDNPDSFRRTVDKVRKLPVAVRVFHCLVLPSALMKRSPAHFDLKYDPFTLQVISCLGWSRKDLEDACRWLDDEARNESGEIPHGGTWKFPRPEQPAGQRDRSAADGPTEIRAAGAWKRLAPAHEIAVTKELHDALARQIDEAAGWSLAELTFTGGDVRAGLELVLETGTSSVDLRIAPGEPDSRAFRNADGVSYSYGTQRHSRPDAGTLSQLDRIISRIHPIAQAIIAGVEGAKRDLRALPVVEQAPGLAMGSDAPERGS